LDTHSPFVRVGSKFFIILITIATTITIIIKSFKKIFAVIIQKCKDFGSILINNNMLFFTNNKFCSALFSFRSPFAQLQFFGTLCVSMRAFAYSKGSLFALCPYFSSWVFIFISVTLSLCHFGGCV